MASCKELLLFILLLQGQGSGEDKKGAYRKPGGGGGNLEKACPQTSC